MGKKIDLTGQKFGELVVLQETNERLNKSVVWLCQCSCGKQAKYSTKQLRSDGQQSCSQCGLHSIPKNNLIQNIIGQKFGHWTVIKKTDKRQSDKILYECECDCLEHTHRLIPRTDLISGRTQSCGCATRKYKKGQHINHFTIIDYTNGHEVHGSSYFAKCDYCGKIIPINNFRLEQNLSCGCLTTSKGEFEIEQILKENNIPYRREYQFSENKYRYDFAIFNPNNTIYELIEFDGETHFLEGVNNRGWNTQEKYEKTVYRDQQKDIFAEEKGIPLIRINYHKRGKITLEDLKLEDYNEICRWF